MAYKISEAAAASRLSIKAIRHYEHIGLIPPAPRTNGAGYGTTGQRLYSSEDIGRLQFIYRARLLDLRLEEIRELMAAAEGHCPGSIPRYREILVRHLEKIETQMLHLETLHANVQKLLTHFPYPVRECFDADCSCLEMELSGQTSTQINPTTFAGEKNE